MLKTKFAKDDINSLLKLIGCCTVLVEVQYRAGEYLPNDYGNFYDALSCLSRIKKWNNTDLTRYLSSKEKEYIEKCLHMAYLAGLKACENKRVSTTFLTELTEIYKSLSL